MERCIKIINNINTKLGNLSSFFLCLLMIVITIDVVLRYMLNLSFIWIIEVETYLFAFIFLLGAGYTFKHEKHVRVDLFYCNYSPKKKAIVDLTGAILLLFPWCIMIMYFCFFYALSSFNINENSSQPGGLPALYFLKATLFAGFFFLFLQGVSKLLTDLVFITKK